MIFLDASGLIAAFYPRDQNHAAGVAAYEELRLGRTLLATTYFVLSEVTNVLCRRTSAEVAIEAGNTLLQSEQILFLDVPTELHQRAWRIFSKYKDWDKLSYTDCTCFALMEQMKIKKAFTFDSGFEHYGFQIMPSAQD